MLLTSYRHEYLVNRGTNRKPLKHIKWLMLYFGSRFGCFFMEDLVAEINDTTR